MSTPAAVAAGVTEQEQALGMLLGQLARGCYAAVKQGEESGAAAAQRLTGLLLLAGKQQVYHCAVSRCHPVLYLPPPPVTSCRLLYVDALMCSARSSHRAMPMAAPPLTHCCVVWLCCSAAFHSTDPLLVQQQLLGHAATLKPLLEDLFACFALDATGAAQLLYSRAAARQAVAYAASGPSQEVPAAPSAASGSTSSSSSEPPGGASPQGSTDGAHRQANGIAAPPNRSSSGKGAPGVASAPGPELPRMPLSLVHLTSSSSYTAVAGVARALGRCAAAADGAAGGWYANPCMDVWALPLQEQRCIHLFCFLYIIPLSHYAGTHAAVTDALMTCKHTGLMVRQTPVFVLILNLNECCWCDCGQALYGESMPASRYLLHRAGRTQHPAPPHGPAPDSPEGAPAQPPPPHPPAPHPGPQGHTLALPTPPSCSSQRVAVWRGLGAVCCSGGGVWRQWGLAASCRNSSSSRCIWRGCPCRS